MLRKGVGWAGCRGGLSYRHASDGAPGAEMGAVGLRWKHRAGWLRPSKTSLESTAHWAGRNLHSAADRPRGPGQLPPPSDSRSPFRTVGLVTVTVEACGGCLAHSLNTWCPRSRRWRCWGAAPCRGPWADPAPQPGPPGAWTGGSQGFCEPSSLEPLRAPAPWTPSWKRRP